MTIEDLATIEDVRKYHFDPKEVIKGLNGYYESDKCNSYITVRRNDVEGPAYLSTNLWLSALIEWLRKDYDIFYRPGLIFDQVEAARNAAKICCLRAHIKDEISKRGLWCTAEEDIPALVDTLFGAYDECKERADKNRKDVVKLSEENQELRKELNALKDTVSKVRSRLNKKFCPIGYEDDLEKLADIVLKAVEASDESINRIVHKDAAVWKNVMNCIRQEPSQNGFDLPRACQDLIEDLKKQEVEIKELKEHITLLETDLKKAKMEKEKFLIEVADREEEIESLSRNAERETQKSDTNKLIRDCCIKHHIVAPSRYLSDKACVECLFSLIEQKDRSFIILQDLYRDIFKKQPDGLSAKDVATKILDKVLEIKGRLDHKEAEVVGEIRVKQYEKDLLKFIYKEYEDRTHLSDKIITYNPPSVRNTVLKIIRDYARSRTRVDILEGRIKCIFDRCKTDFTVDDHVINGEPTISFMLDCIGSWICSPAESHGKTRAEIENYKMKLKDYILHDIKEHGYRYNGLETKSIEEIVDWIITMATSDHSFIVLKDIYTTVASPAERLRYNGCDGPTVDHMKEYILRRFEGLRANTEYCLKKMAELDGCQKDLKILEEQQKWLIQQNSELATKVSTKDDEISRLKGLINEINKEEDGEWFKP